MFKKNNHLYVVVFKLVSVKVKRNILFIDPSVCLIQFIKFEILVMIIWFYLYVSSFLYYVVAMPSMYLLVVWLFQISNHQWPLKSSSFNILSFFHNYCYTLQQVLKEKWIWLALTVKVLTDSIYTEPSGSICPIFLLLFICALIQFN